MTVLTHDIMIEGINLEGLEADIANIDLDCDDVADLKLTSTRDSIDSGTGIEVWGVFLETTNPLFSVLEISNSGDNYYTETPYWLNGVGFPRLERRLTTGCQREGAMFSGIEANNPKTYSEGDAFQPKQVDWSTNGYGYLELATSGSEYMECRFTDDSDSLICDITITEPTCFPIPTDETTYLIFRKFETTECYSIGWIEILLMDENKLEIKRSAISNKPLEF